MVDTITVSVIFVFQNSGFVYLFRPTLYWNLKCVNAAFLGSLVNMTIDRIVTRAKASTATLAVNNVYIIEAMSN